MQPNTYQKRHHDNFIKKQQLSIACARLAILELAELGFTVSSIRLGLHVTISVQPVSRSQALGLRAFD